MISLKLAAVAAALLTVSSASAQSAPPASEPEGVAGTPAAGEPLPSASPPASASPRQPPPGDVQSGFTMGARLGLAFPSGRTAKGASDSYGAMVPVAIPLQFDVGVRLPAGLGLGGYVQVASAAPDCNPGVTCSALLFRIGAQADLRFNQRGRAMPWVGVMLGWEFFDFIQKTGGTEVDQAMSGLEWGVQGGLDLRVGRRWAIGPYGQLGFGTYTQATVSIDGNGTSASIPTSDRARHQWFTLGAKATVTF